MNDKTYAKIYASHTAPDPKMHALWMDLTASPYGSVLKYWNGSAYSDLNATDAELSAGLSAKANIASPTFTGTVKMPALSIGAAGAEVAITATATELNYVDGVTSSIQTQLSSKAPLINPVFIGTGNGLATIVCGDSSDGKYSIGIDVNGNSNYGTISAITVSGQLDGDPIPQIIYGDDSNTCASKFIGTAYFYNISTTAPATASSTGIKGEVRYTSDYIYVCVDTNTWKRTAITTW